MRARRLRNDSPLQLRNVDRLSGTQFSTVRRAKAGKHEGVIKSSSKDHADAPYVAGFRRDYRMMIAHVTVDQS
jgi:hypothetical protein